MSIGSKTWQGDQQWAEGDPAKSITGHFLNGITENCQICGGKGH
tara:strand:- start:342 stop:473 length:132 start_codon:yes stop_codon:yes gene_type:complete